MNIVVLTADEPLYVTHFFGPFLAAEVPRLPTQRCERGRDFDQTLELVPHACPRAGD